MAMGKRKPRQESLCITSDQLAPSAGHPFYQRLNHLLDEARFDRWIEERCAPCYVQTDQRGQPSLPPGVYFRMLLVGYFENIDSQRGVAWRCSDGLSLRVFLGIPLGEGTPDHSTLTNTRKRLPQDVFEEVFQFVLGIAEAKKLIAGKTVGVDSTTLEANAAMKSIVRRDTGEDWKEYVVRLMREEGVIGADEKPSTEEILRYDRKRKDKTVSHTEWTSETDADAKIARMKDGTTHLAYKAEHVVDLGSDLVLAAEIRPANAADTATLADSLVAAPLNLTAAGSAAVIDEAAGDKGYHAAATIESCDFLEVRTYIPEPKLPQPATWADKPEEQRRAALNNRRRMARSKGKALQRRRREVVERTFAHVCETGGSRRTHSRGLTNVTKRYRIAVAAHNLGRILRRMTGIGKPKAGPGVGGRAARVTGLDARLRNARSEFARTCLAGQTVEIMVFSRSYWLKIAFPTTYFEKTRCRPRAKPPCFRGFQTDQIVCVRSGRPAIQVRLPDGSRISSVRFEDLRSATLDGSQSDLPRKTDILQRAASVPSCEFVDYFLRHP